MTTWPPRMACTATPRTAINPSHRSHGRFSFTQSNTASTRVRTPKPPAKTRCENSSKSPPCSIDSEGTHVPWDFGQSVTERAASLDVTSAPATKRRTVQQTVNTANLCTPALYVVIISRPSGADYTFNLPQAKAEPKAHQHRSPRRAKPDPSARR